MARIYLQAPIIHGLPPPNPMAIVSSNGERLPPYYGTPADLSGDASTKGIHNSFGEFIASQHQNINELLQSVNIDLYNRHVQKRIRNAYIRAHNGGLGLINKMIRIIAHYLVLNHENQIKFIEANTMLYNVATMYKCYIQSCAEDRESGMREITMFRIMHKQYTGQTPLNYDFASLKGLQPLRHTKTFEEVQAAFMDHGLDLVETPIGYDVIYFGVVIFRLNEDFMFYDEDDDNIRQYFTNFSFDPRHEAFEVDELPNICPFEVNMYDMMEAMKLLAMHMEFGNTTTENAICLPGNERITLGFDEYHRDRVNIVFIFRDQQILRRFKVPPEEIPAFVGVNIHLFQ